MDSLWQKVMAKYHHTCVLCLRGADCVHHEPPLSMQDEREEDMYPLCLDCHTEGEDAVHKHRGGAKERLEEGAKFVLAMFGGPYEGNDRKR